MRQTSARCILSALAGSLLLGLAGCGSPHASATSSANAIEIVIDANELVSAFEKAPDRAAMIYSGKRARISGYFLRTETLEDGRAAIVFKPSIATYRPLRCVDPDTELDVRITELDSGSPMTVDGTIGGFTDSSYFVTVDDCSVR